jgi:hypothetical protein
MGRLPSTNKEAAIGLVSITKEATGVGKEGAAEAIEEQGAAGGSTLRIYISNKIGAM